MKIKTIRSWSMDNVRDVCVKYGYYTQGSNKDYEKMLCYVLEHNPTPKNLYTVAADIMAHSDPEACDSVEGIMYIIESEAVLTLYSVEEG